jgi:hypothetical protein
MLLMTSLIFALQMTAVTPLSASTSNQHVENQQQAAAEGTLSIALQEGALRRAILFWNETSQGFHNSSKSYYVGSTPPNRFGQLLEKTFTDRGIAYNVILTYHRADGRQRDRRMVYRGRPSDNAVRSTQSVTLYDDSHLIDEDGTETETTVSESTGFYAQDTASGPVFNVVRVEVVVWRI